MRILILLLFLTGVAFSQDVNVKNNNLDAGWIPQATFTDVDSAETLYSESFDPSSFDGQSTIYGYTFADGSGTDTVLFILQGKFPDETTWIDIDTLASATSSGYKSTISISGTGYPVWRFVVKGVDLSSGSPYDATCRVYLYSTVLDAMPAKRNWMNKN